MFTPGDVLERVCNPDPWTGVLAVVLSTFGEFMRVKLMHSAEVITFDNSGQYTNYWNKLTHLEDGWND